MKVQKRLYQKAEGLTDEKYRKIISVEIVEFLQNKIKKN